MDQENTKPKRRPPSFASHQTLACGHRVIVTDADGFAWLIDPERGTVEPAVYDFE